MQDMSVYKAKYPYGTMNQLTSKRIAENMLSEVESEGHHYQVSNEVTDHKRDNNAITKVNGFIKSSNDGVHSKTSPFSTRHII